MTTLLLPPAFSDSTFRKLFIGLDKFADEFSDLHLPESNYPPFNLILVDKEHYLVELAVAGFDSKDISISTENGLLTIESIKNSEKPTDTREFIHRGIGRREFFLQFKLNQYVFVTNAEFQNGILSIKLEYKLPDHLKNQKISITTK
jgi:molecular chaperone IbpA